MTLSNQPFYKKAPDRDEHAFLLLHGLGGGVYEMALIGERLHQLGYSVKGINYPGHDAPALRMPVSRWEDWYAHVESEYRHLAGEHRHVSVVGFSTGCLLGLHLAAHHPVHRQVLLAPFLKVRHEWYFGARPETYVRKIGHLVPDIPRMKLPIKDPAMMALAHKAAYFRTFNIGAVKSALELIDVVHTEMDRVEAPTLIIHSRKDSVVCPTSVDILERKLPAPKEICWLSDSDHVICLDVEREQVLSRIEAFVAP